MADEPRLAIESIAGLRPYQEDSVLAETLEDGRVLVAVADGMGGHAAGEVASALALDTLKEAVRAGRSLRDAFTAANARVFAMSREPGKQGMGTTLVAALVDGERVELANVGDSRCYVISGDGIRQVTQDHSFVAEAVRRGQSEAEAMAGPWKDALTRSIGTEEEVDVDVYGPMPLSEDSALLVCSDGLYKVLTEAEVLRIYSESGGPRGAAQSLVSHALESGSDDNITVAIAEYGEVRRLMFGGTMPLDFVIRPEDIEEADRKAGRPSGTGDRDDAASREASTRPSTPVPTPETPASSGHEESGARPSATRMPVGAIAAVVVVVGALLALLVLG